MASEDHLDGVGKQRVQSKLRMVRNGGSTVNAVRAKRCAAVAQRTKKTKEQAKSNRQPQWESVDAGASDIIVDVFIELQDEFVDLYTSLCLPNPKDFNDDPPELELKITKAAGRYLTAEVTLSMLDMLQSCDKVVSIELGQELKVSPPILARQSQLSKRPPARRISSRFKNDGGKNVLIGIIDIGGFDFSHPDFLDENGQTRFVEIWDQAASTRKPPESFAYGALIEQQHMNRAIDASRHTGGLPAYELEPQSLQMRSSHATHVASIAAGKYGVCPQAKLAGVSLALPSDELDRRSSLYDSTRLAHAVDYLFKLGSQLPTPLPVVVNISLGTNGHAHDGSSIVNRWLERALDVPGRAICVAAGNAGQEAPTGPDDLGFMLGRIHSSGQITASGLSSDLEWVVVGDGQGDLSENELEIWYGPQDRMAIEVRPPGSNKWLGPIEPGEFLENKWIKNTGFLSVYNNLYAPSNGDNHIALFLSPFMSETQPMGIKRGTWTVRLHGRDIRDGRFNAWIERDDPRRIRRLDSDLGWAYPSFFSRKTAVDNSTVNSLAAGHRIISVANYNPHQESIHITSSQGPTRDGRDKPEIAAPGSEVLAANGFSPRDQAWVKMTGTSMASPYVAGVAGLMLSADRQLTSAQISGILKRNAQPLPSANYRWQNDAGFGVVDAASSVREAQKIHLLKDKT